MTTILRQAARADLPALHRIRKAVRENMLTSSVITDEQIIEEIEKTGRGWVIEDEGNVVAFAIGNRETASVWALFVEPGHEGRGYGRRLHDIMVEWLFEQGLERIWLSTDPGTRAQRFYETAGWSLIRVLPDGANYYELERAAGDAL
jgi:GNAT superfamily N-acetyltransferase